MNGYSFGAKYRVHLIPTAYTAPGAYSMYFLSVRSSPIFWMILDD